jgi:hypothetical protein
MALLSFADSTPRAYRLKVSNACPPISTSTGTSPDECMVGIGGTPAHWYPGDRDVPPQAQLHHSVVERLKKDRVRNFTSYGPYRPAL